MISPNGVRFAVLIPTRGRGRRVTKLWKEEGKMHFLDASGVFLGVDHRDRDNDYDLEHLGRAFVEYVHNPSGSVAHAREHLRQVATSHSRLLPKPYRTYVLTDDNATFTREALDRLVDAQDALSRHYDEPVIMAGSHTTAAQFDRFKIKYATEVDGFTTYERLSAIFWAIPAPLYEAYKHPSDAFGYDDRHLALWLIDRGVKHFRVCVGANYAKGRYQKGGQGALIERVNKNATATGRLLADFPKLMGLFEPAIPLKTMLAYKAGELTTRLGRHNAK
jgi:hypothetical protein